MTKHENRIAIEPYADLVRHWGFVILASTFVIALE
jgi:hypothetical protein